MKLYWNRLSPNCKRARLCAAELDIPLELVELDFAKGENRTPEYLAKNPMGKVPTLDDNGYVLWESPADIFYLASKSPGKGLWPSDPKRQAEALRWMFWNASHFEEAIFMVVNEKMIKPMMSQKPDPAFIKAGESNFARFAPVLNA